MAVFGPTPPQIWDWLQRKVPLTLHGFLTLSGDGLLEISNAFLLKHIVSSDEAVIQVINSPTSNVNVETERLNITMWSGIWGKGRLLGYRFAQGIMREWIDTIAGTYRYKSYVRPCYLTNAGAIVDLEAEQNVGDHSHPQVGVAQWQEDSLNVAIRRTGLNLAFDGLLGLRFRTTSWVVAGLGVTGHGIGGINHIQNWLATFNWQMD